MSRVIAVRQSARDERTWQLELDCGHQLEVVSTSKRPTAGRPTRRVHACDECIAARRARMERS